MDEKERKKEPLLPPNYVSFAQLQERWLQKQQEEKKKKKKKMREKEEEEEEKQRDARTQNENRNQGGLRNDGHEIVLGGSLREVRRRGVGNYRGVIEGKGKGKQILIDGPENGEINETRNKKKKKKKKNKHFKRENSAADGVKENEVEKEKGRDEIEECDGGNRSEEVKIVPWIDVKAGQRVLSGKSSEKGGVSGGLKGVEEIAIVSTVEALPRYGVRRETTDVKRTDFRGGFRRNGDNSRVSGYKGRTEYRVQLKKLKETEVELDLEKEMDGEKGYSKRWGRRRRNGGNRESYCRMEKGRPHVLKGNEVEPESEEKAEDEICSETCGLIGRDGNGLLDLKKEMEGEKGYSKMRRGRRDGGNRESYCRLEEGSRTDVLKGKEVEPESEEMAEDEICSETCGSDGRDGTGLLDLKKKMEGEKGYSKTWRGKWRNGGNRESYCRLEEGRNDVLKGNEVEPESEEKSEDEICSETCGLDGRDGNGLLDLKKKMEGEKGYSKTWRGRGRNGGNRESYCRLEEGRPDVLKGNEVEPESEEKAGDDICSETCGLDGRDGNGLLHQIKNGKYNTKEHRVEGEELSDAKVALEKKVDDEVVLVENAKNGEEMGGMEKGYRGYGNCKDKINRQFRGLNFNGKVRSVVEVNAGEGRRYARFEKVGDRRKMKQKEGGMMWVKKEVKPGADAAEDGTSVSGISVDRE